MKTRLLLSLALAGLLPSLALAQGTNVRPESTNISNRLTKTPRHQETVKIKQGDREISAFIVYPEVKEKAMSVILVHEIFGLTDWVKATADQLAENGYIAIAPDLLSGLGPNKGGTLDLPETGVGGAIQALPAAQITADLNAVADYVTKLPAANGNFAIAGFCWGGGTVFKFATQNKDVKAAFVFYGSPAPTADMKNINCPIYGFYGGSDARISATVPATTEAMKAAGKTYESVIYDGAGHGFMRTGQMDQANLATDANKKAMTESWKTMLGVLAKLSGKPAPAATTPALAAAAAPSTPAAPATTAPKP
jgi:carboxymethylenebutenolidase